MPHLETIRDHQDHIQKRSDRNRTKKERRIKTGSVIRSSYFDQSMRKPLRVICPEYMNLGEQCEETLDFLDRVRQVARGGACVAIMDFTHLRDMSIEAGLLVAAVAASLRSKYPGRCHGFHSKSDEVNWILNEFGYFDAIGVLPPSIRDETFKALPGNKIKIRTGTVVNPEKGGGHISDDVATSIIPEGILQKKATRSLNEALANSFEHAFPWLTDSSWQPPSAGWSEPHPDLLPHWWMCGYVNRETNEFGFLALDVGMGIPASMQRRWGHIIRSTLAGMFDGQSLASGSVDHHLVSQAMTLGNSGQTLPGRGKGFDDIKRLVDQADGGSLRVVSGRGDCRYHGGDISEAKLIPAAFPGTMISWTLRGSRAIARDESDELAPLGAACDH